MKIKFTLYKKHVKLDNGVQFDAYKIKTLSGEWKDCRLVKDATKLKNAELPAVVEVETGDCFISGKTVDGKHYESLVITKAEYLEKAKPDDANVLAFLGATEIKDSMPF